MIDFKSSKLYVQSICIDIINNISRSFLNTGAEALDIVDANLNLINNLLEFDTISDIQTQVTNILMCCYL